MKKSFSWSVNLNGSSESLNSINNNSKIDIFVQSPEKDEHIHEPNFSIKRLVSKLRPDSKRKRTTTNSSQSTDGSREDVGTSDSARKEQDFNVGRAVKVKGSRLKNDVTFGNLIISQKLFIRDEPLPVNRETSLHRRSNSMSSIQNSAEMALSHGVWIIRFNADGTFLASGRQDGVVVIWKRRKPDDSQRPFDMDELSSTTSLSSKVNLSLQPTFENIPHAYFKGHDAAIVDLAWSTGNLLISSSLDRTVRLWYPDTRECLSVFHHSDCVTSVRFHPFDDNFFASGTYDGKIRVWNIKEKRLVCFNEIANTPITSIYITKDGSNIVAGTFTGTCVFYSFLDLKYITQIQVTNQKSYKHSNAKVTGIESVTSRNSYDETFLVTTADSKVRLFNLRDKSLAKTYKGADITQGRSFASFSHDGDFIVIAGEDKNVVIWDTFSQDSSQQFTGVLGSVLHRSIDSAKASGLQKFAASMNFITGAVFAPWSTTSNFVIIVADDHGNIFVYQTIE